MLVMNTGHFAIFPGILGQMVCYRPHLGTNRVGCQCLHGNHGTCLKDYLFARHLQCLNIFFSVYCSLSPVLFSKRNSKGGKVMEIFIHLFHKSFWEPSMCQVLSGLEDTTLYKICSLFSRTLMCWQVNKQLYYSAGIVKITGSTGTRGAEESSQSGLRMCMVWKHVSEKMSSELRLELSTNGRPDNIINGKDLTDNFLNSLNKECTFFAMPIEYSQKSNASTITRFQQLEVIQQTFSHDVMAKLERTKTRTTKPRK